MGDVGRDDDRDDAAVGRADDRARGRRARVLSRTRLPDRLGGIQRRRHWAAVDADAPGDRHADDGTVEPDRRGVSAGACRSLSTDAAEARLPGDVSVAHGFSDEEVAKRIIWRVPY